MSEGSPGAPAGAGRSAGARLPRVEDVRLLTGGGCFVDDVVRPGMLHGCFVRSPFARARVAGIDVDAARRLPGVHAVLVAADLNPQAREQWHTSIGPDVPEAPRPPLADDEVRFVGDPVALVVAADRYVAEDAADLVVVDLEPLPPVVDYEGAAAHEGSVHGATPGNVIGEMGGDPGPELRAVFDEAPHVVCETFRQHSYAPVPMETRGLVAEWSAEREALTMWGSTQVPHELRQFGARLLGIAEEQIHVIVRDTGGGFGQKVLVQREEMCIMLAARRLSATIKWIEDRRENLLAAGQARHESATARMAFDADGAILAASIDHLQDAGAYPTPWPVGTAAAVGMLFPGPYRIPGSSFRTRVVHTNTVGRTAYRGPWQFESVAREVLLDVAARRLGLDPAELRRRNLLAETDLPFTTATGFTYDHATPLETFEHALAILDYDAFRSEQARARDGGRFLGVGTATFIEPTAPGYGVYGEEGARLRVEASGTVTAFLAGGSSGNSLETTVVQLVADALEVDVADVETLQGDTDRTPFGAGACGSRSASMTAGAIGETAAVLRSRILDAAAEHLEAAVEDLELVGGGRVSVRGTPTRGVSYAELAATSTEPAGALEATATYTAAAPQVWSNATHVCTCQVDVATGQVHLLRYVVSEDCGPMINPAVVEGQIAGGTVQGIGGALYEHLVYDDDGNPLTTTFLDYLLPTATEVPLIEYGHVETRAPTPGGYKGVGEGGAIGAPPAVINAVADALVPFDVTITEQPLTPSRVLELVGAVS